jgi:hypothetical protein
MKKFPEILIQGRVGACEVQAISFLGKGPYQKHERHENNQEYDRTRDQRRQHRPHLPGKKTVNRIEDARQYKGKHENRQIGPQESAYKKNSNQEYDEKVLEYHLGGRLLRHVVTPPFIHSGSVSLLV